MSSYARHLAAAAAFVLLLSIIELAGIRSGNAQDSTADRIAALEAQVRNLQTQVTNLQAQLTNQQSAISAESSARKQGESDILAAAKAISDRQVAAIADKIAHFSRVGNEVYITGANLHIVNGAGKTDLTNGLGNVIVGYNELRADGSDNRIGSHNLVVGRENNFTGFGSLLAGFHNSSTGGGSITGGAPSKVASGSVPGNPSGSEPSKVDKTDSHSTQIKSPAASPSTARTHSGSNSSHRKASSRYISHRRAWRSMGRKSAPVHKSAAHPSSGPGRPPGR